MNNDHRVVIIGGGFGGLRAAQALEEAPVDVTLIDRLSPGSRLITGTAPTDFRFDEDVGTARPAPIRAQAITVS